MSRLRLCTALGFLALAFSTGLAAPALLAQSAAGTTAASSDDPVARGAYVVERVAQCGRCHSPVDSTGERNRSRWLQGGPLDFEPTIAKQNWAMAAPRIAGTPPGTDAEFIKLMTTGISRNGKPMRRPMPQFLMSQTDAEAVLAYLKSLSGHQRPGTD